MCKVCAMLLLGRIASNTTGAAAAVDAAGTGAPAKADAAKGSAPTNNETNSKFHTELSCHRHSPLHHPRHDHGQEHVTLPSVASHRA